MYDLTLSLLVVAVLAALGVATFVGWMLKRQTDTGLNPAVIEQFNQRIRAWWLLCAVLAAAFFFHRWATVLLFFFLSFWALREFITLTPTRVADHRALFWVFFFFTPLQYVLVGLNQYGLYSILIPVYAFLFIPARIAVAGDSKRYLERCAKIQAGLMICVYCLSHAPAVLYLELKPGPSASARTPPAEQPMTRGGTGSEADPRHGSSPDSEVNATAEKRPAGRPRRDPPVLPLRPRQAPEENARLLFFFLLVVTMGEGAQHVSHWLWGKTVIAPAISMQRTWEGLVGGVLGGTALGTGLWWATSFNPLQAAGLSLATTVMGFAGGMTMSAIKRDRGVKDYGTLVVGHGGVLDRIDAICFAAPVFFHLTRLLIAEY
jgi:phosphatidate cytidylyltransferase